MKKKLAFTAAMVTTAAFIMAGVGPAQAASPVTVISPISAVTDSSDYYGAVDVSDDGSLVAVAFEYAGVTIYNVADNTQVDITITTMGSSDIGAPAFAPDNSVLYVADYSNGNIIVIDLSDYSVSSPLSSPSSYPWIPIVSPDGNFIYFQEYGSRYIYKMDLTTSDTSYVSLVGTEEFYTGSLCTSGDGSLLYAPTFANDSLAVIDTATMAVADDWTTGSGTDPYSCTSDNEGNLIVGLQGTSSVVKFAPDGTSKAAADNVVTDMQGAAASCDTIYVANSNDPTTIPALDLNTFEVQTPITPTESSSGSHAFVGYSAARSLDGSIVAIGGYYTNNGLVIINTDCGASLADTGASAMVLVGTGTFSAGLLAAGALALIVVRRRQARK